jgi:hypothetical protein
LNPPLREVDVVAFEDVHKVSLPPDFRQVLTEVGNGGAGPLYGVFPLARWTITSAIELGKKMTV